MTEVVAVVDRVVVVAPLTHEAVVVVAPPTHEAVVVGLNFEAEVVGLSFEEEEALAEVSVAVGIRGGK